MNYYQSLSVVVFLTWLKVNVNCELNLGGVIMKFGEFLKNLRIEKNLSQRQLADLAKISNTEISRIESGKRQKPSPNILKAIAPHLEISYSELMINAGYIEETIEHEKFYEKIFRDNNGIFADTFRMVKDIQDKDYELLKIMSRVSSELCDDDINAIKNIANLYLNQNKNHNENQ